MSSNLSFPSARRLKRAKQRGIRFFGAGVSAGLGMLALTSVLGHAATQFYPGVVQREYYLNITGGLVNDLRANAKFPSKPDLNDYATSVEAITGYGDNYGIKISGVLIPPADGEYTFWVSGDDNCEVWLSTDENPANITLIAREPEWNDARQWVVTDRRDPLNPQNRSASIPLVGAKQYYFEALMKEGGGGDSLGVTALPTGNLPANGDASTLTDSIIGVYADDGISVGQAAVVSGIAVPGSNVIIESPVHHVPPGTVSYQWFRNNSPVAGATGRSIGFVATAEDNGASYALQVTVDGKSATGAAAVLALEIPVESRGFAKVELFNNIGAGTAVNDLVTNQKYIDNTPDQTLYVPGFEYNGGTADNYGGRMTGIFVAPADGEYIFYIAADDGAELFISSDEDPANLQSVATQPAWSNFREWLTNQGGGAQVPSKVSAPIALSQGGRYLIQGLWKEGGGGDNFAATYILAGEAEPANNSPSKISGLNLVNMVPQNGAAVNIATQPASVTIPVGTFTTLSIGASASNNSNPSLPISYQWQKNTGAGFEDIVGATSASLNLPIQTLADSGTKYRVLLYTLGAQSTSSEATITVVEDTFPPTVASAGAMRNFNTDGIEVQVIFSEALDEATATTLANYTLSSGNVTAARYVRNSSGRSSLESGVVLTTTGLTPGASVNLTVRNIADSVGNKLASAVVLPVKVSKMSWASIGRVLGPNLDDVDPLLPAAFNTAGDSGFNLVSGGASFWSVNDDITFVHEEVTGNFDKALNMDFIDSSSRWGRAGLTVRESLNEGRATTGTGGDNPASRYQNIHSNPAFKFNGDPANNQVEFNRRLTTGGETDSNGAVGNAPWLRMKYTGGVIDMFTSTDGVYYRPVARTDVRAADPAWGPSLFVGPVFSPENGNIGANGEPGGPEDRKEYAVRVRSYGDVGSKALGQATYAVGLSFGANETGGMLDANDVAGAPLFAQKHWNSIEGQAGTFPDPNAAVPQVVVADKAGTAEDTTITVEFNSANTWASHGPRGENNNVLPGQDAVLMAGYLDTTDNSTASAKILNIPSAIAEGGYDVVVYTLGGIGQGRGGGYRSTDDQGNVLKPYILSQANDNPTEFLQNPEEPGSTTRGTGNYLVFRGLNSPNIIVEASTTTDPELGELGSGGTQRAPLNAIQIVSPSGIGTGGAPTISISANGQITFTGKLLQADKVDGPYTEVNGATSPFTPPANSVKFYRSSN